MGDPYDAIVLSVVTLTLIWVICSYRAHCIYVSCREDMTDLATYMVLGNIASVAGLVMYIYLSERTHPMSVLIKCAWVGYAALSLVLSVAFFAQITTGTSPFWFYTYLISTPLTVAAFVIIRTFYVSRALTTLKAKAEAWPPR